MLVLPGRRPQDRATKKGAPTREPSQSKQGTKVYKRCCRARFSCCLLVAVALLGPGASGLWWLSVFFFFFFLFPGDDPKTDLFWLAAAGVTFQLSDGRDVGSRAKGTDPRTGAFRYPLRRYSRGVFVLPRWARCRPHRRPQRARVQTVLAVLLVFYAVVFLTSCRPDRVRLLAHEDS